jgi:hypothetical protein
VNGDGRGDCEECVADGLSRIFAVRDLLDDIIWGETHPTNGVNIAIRGLQNARAIFMAAGFEVES